MGSYLFLAVRTLAAVVIAASLWPFAADRYNALVVRLAGGFLPTDIAARAGEGRIYLDFLAAEKGAGLGLHGYVLHFGLILVAALVVTTPGLGLVRAVAWTAGVLGLFLAIHVVGVALFVWGIHAATQEDGGVTIGQVMTAFAVFWALLPAVIGGAWCYWRWLPTLRVPGRKDGVPLDNASADR
ncbi:MAG: hypothetical protein EXR53_05795 [Dehalococcoidia bacterium]|nr:hypothetical protein [Dehalococcoidia bacterium]